MWWGISASQTSVSQAISGVCFLNSVKLGKAVTKTFPTLQFFNIASSSTTLLGDIGPWDVTTSIKNNHLFLLSNKTISGNLSCSVIGIPNFDKVFSSTYKFFLAVSPR